MILSGLGPQPCRGVPSAGGCVLCGLIVVNAEFGALDAPNSAFTRSKHCFPVAGGTPGATGASEPEEAPPRTPAKPEITGGSGG